MILPNVGCPYSASHNTCTFTPNTFHSCNTARLKTTRHFRRSTRSTQILFVLVILIFYLDIATGIRNHTPFNEILYSGSNHTNSGNSSSSSLSAISHQSSEEIISPHRKLKDLTPNAAQKVDFGAYPWFARAIKDMGNPRSPCECSWFFSCGGSLITPEYVLTSAFQLNQTDFRNHGGYRIGSYCGSGLGGYKYSNCKQQVETFPVKDVFIHPNYTSNFGHSFHDLALVRLDGVATIKPVEIDQGDISPAYERLSQKGNLWRVGFGNMMEGDYPRPTTFLMHTQETYIKQEECVGSHPDYPSPPSIMCAGVNDRNELCQNQIESGGPLFDSENEVLVGVMGWWIGNDGECMDTCSGSYYDRKSDDEFVSSERRKLLSCPQIYAREYARVSHYLPWIKSVVCETHGNPKPTFCPTSSNGQPKQSVSVNVPAKASIRSNRILAESKSLLLDTPTSPPSESQTYAPTRISCVDDPLGWHLGEGENVYNCDWFRSGNGNERCQAMGNKEGIFPYERSANRACCVCGGGITVQYQCIFPGEPENVALTGAAKQSSTCNSQNGCGVDGSFSASFAIDGNIGESIVGEDKIAKTSGLERSPWWQVKLRKVFRITYVQIYYLQNHGFGDKVIFELMLMRNGGIVHYTSRYHNGTDPYEFEFPEDTWGDAIMAHLYLEGEQGQLQLTLQEVMVYAIDTKDRDIPPAAVNVALGKKTSQASTPRPSRPSSSAVNGRYINDYAFVAASSYDISWEVDLEGTFVVSFIRVYNLLDRDREELKDFTVEVLGGGSATSKYFVRNSAKNFERKLFYDFRIDDANFFAEKVRITNFYRGLSLSEVEVFGYNVDEP